MKFTLAWLKEHLDTDRALGEITDKLTMIGLEVERVEDMGKELAPFTIARVVEAKQHPNADRLRVCMVDTGSGDPVQVVCGAPNARTGMKGVFVPPGAYIPGKDMTLAVGTIRGVESRGMLVSEFELKISDDHEGIIDLPDDAPVGEAYAKYAGLDDPVIEINLTPNRPDCAGVHGIARDLAAADIGKFKDTAIKPVKGEFPCPVAVKIETPELCPAFALRLVRGVKNGPSPAWLQKRLTAIGLRPINALVDITNFITYDRGRPLHVFDAAKVRGNLTVRRAQNGEKLLALDGKTYTLDDSVCVIADEDGVESLSGIMGGETTGCSETTTDVLIELALWNEINIAQTGRKLGINSDARYRFERGVDPAFMLPGLELATRMVLDLCGGTPSEATVAGSAEPRERIIDFPLSELKRLAGLTVPQPEMRRVLERLGFFVAGQSERVKIAVPSWRPDVEGKADIVEEVVRIVGVDKVPSTPFDRGEAPRKPVLTAIQLRVRKAKRALAARNLVEAVTWSFISKAHAELFGGGKPELALANPIAADLSDMRPSLIPGLIAAAQKNADRGLPRRRPVRSRPDISRRRASGSGYRRGRRAPRAGKTVRHRPALDQARRRGRRVRCQSRRTDGADSSRRAGASTANRARRPAVVSSRALRHHPDRPAKRARPFRRIASRHAGKTRRQRPAGRLRSHSRAHPRAEGESDPRQAGAGAVAVPAGRARFCFRGRAQRESRRHRARGAVGRPQADRRRHLIRRLRRQRYRARQEIDRHRRHDSAARQDHDRRRDRSAGGKDRR